MSQHDGTIANASGATVRADVQSAIQAALSTSKGPTAPATPYAGQLWIDDNTPSASVWTLFAYDGADWTSILTFDTTNNRVSLTAYDVAATGAATVTGTLASSTHTINNSSGVVQVGFATTAGPTYTQTVASGDQNYGFSTLLQFIHVSGTSLLARFINSNLSANPFDFNMSNGNAYATGTWNTTSSREVKERFVQIADPLAGLQSLEIGTYFRKGQPGAEAEFGGIAESFVGTAGEGLVGYYDRGDGKSPVMVLNAGGAGMYALAVTQALERRVIALEARIAALGG